MNRTVDRPNLRDQVYDILRDMIIRREIQPGEKINEEQLAERIGVSRTPIRETLCRLENEGMVKVIPRRGAFVTSLTGEGVAEVLQIREALEGLVARLATERMDEPTLDALRSCLHRVDATPENARRPILYTRAEEDFHAILLNACGNQMLTNMMEVVNAHLKLIRVRTVVLPGRAGKSVEEHHQILKAIEKRDAILAEEIMRRHVTSVRDDALRSIESVV
jgi:GntR family transcriptional regulator, rspAB operon transcriptional repressor